jgi:cytochrome c oxidase subunit IV
METLVLSIFEKDNVIVVYSFHQIWKFLVLILSICYLPPAFFNIFLRLIICMPYNPTDEDFYSFSVLFHFG